MSGRHANRVAFGLFVVQLTLLLWNGLRHSPTYDEVAHLPAGLSHWQLGDYRLFRVNPPLVRMIAAVPVLIAGAETDWRELESLNHPGTGGRVDFNVGRDFIKANGAWSFWLYTFARWTCAGFVLLGGWIVWKWSTELYGEVSGLVGLTIWTFSPMVLGHGALITPDVPAAAVGAMAVYLFWRWTRNPDWASAYLAGIGLGLALLTKTTWVILIPMMTGLWLVMMFVDRDRLRGLRLIQSAHCVSIFAVSLVVLNLAYGADGVFKPLGEYRFSSIALVGDKRSDDETGNRFQSGLLASIPLPLPQQFVLGVDVQKTNFEQKTLSYLRGNLRREGWWYYYLYAVGVKSTLGALALLLGVTIWRFAFGDRGGRRSPKRDEWFVLLPLVTVTLLVSSQTGINKHLRYLLPVYPFAIIWLSQAARIVSSRPVYCRIAQRGVAVCVVWSVLSSLWIYPHSMSYFNELVSGPRNGRYHLINSNVDWGQDLFFLQRKLNRLQWDEIGLVYWGRYDARLAGIDFELPPRGPLIAAQPGKGRTLVAPAPGRFAVSANQVQGYAFVAPNGHGGLAMPRQEAYSYFKHFLPVDSAGYSMLLYDVSKADAQRVRTKLKLPVTAGIGLDRMWQEPVEPVFPSRVMTFAPVGDGYCVGGDDAVIRWVHGDQPRTVDEYPSSTDSPIVCMVTDTETGLVISGHQNGKLTVFRCDQNERLQRLTEASLQAETGGVLSLAISPNSKWIGGVDGSGHVSIWTTNDWVLKQTIQCDMTLTSICWVGNQTVAVGGSDWRSGRRGTIRKYNIDGQLMAEIAESRHFMVDLVSTVDGDLVGRGSSGALCVWDGQTNEQKMELVGESPHPLALSADGRFLAAGDSYGVIRLWETSSWDLVFEACEFETRISDIVFGGASERVIGISDGGILKEFRIQRDASQP